MQELKQQKVPMRPANRGEPRTGRAGQEVAEDPLTAPVPAFNPEFTGLASQKARLSQKVPEGARESTLL